MQDVKLVTLKVAQWKNGVIKKTSQYSKFEFSFSVTLYLPFQELFFLVFQLLEVSWASEELSCLPYKNQNKSLTLSFGEGKIQVCYIVRSFIKPFFHWATFNLSRHLIGWLLWCTKLGIFGPIKNLNFQTHNKLLIFLDVTLEVQKVLTLTTAPSLSCKKTLYQISYLST